MVASFPFYNRIREEEEHRKVVRIHNAKPLPSELSHVSVCVIGAYKVVGLGRLDGEWWTSWGCREEEGRARRTRSRRRPSGHGRRGTRR